VLLLLLRSVIFVHNNWLTMAGFIGTAIEQLVTDNIVGTN